MIVGLLDHLGHHLLLQERSLLWVNHPILAELPHGDLRDTERCRGGRHSRARRGAADSARAGSGSRRVASGRRSRAGLCRATRRGLPRAIPRVAAMPLGDRDALPVHVEFAIANLDGAESVVVGNRVERLTGRAEDRDADRIDFLDDRSPAANRGRGTLVRIWASARPGFTVMLSTAAATGAALSGGSTSSCTFTDAGGDLPG